MTRVAAALISGDDFRKEEMRGLLESLADAGIDAVYLSYNGNKAKPPIPAKWLKGMKFHWEYREWDDDFSAARNHSFSLVDRDEYEWIIWADTDDVVRTKDGGIPALLETLDDYTQGIFCRYDYALEPETGTVVVVQWRERMFKTDVDWKWEYPIHEVCKAPSGTQYARRDQLWIEHQRKSGEDRGARERNRRIIARSMREHPQEPRYVFYFASETLAEADAMEPSQERITMIDAAIVAFRKFMQMSNTQSDDLYIAATRVGDLYLMKHDYNGAIDAFLQAVKIYPDWTEAYVGISKACMELGDYPRMRGFADIACRLDSPYTAASREPLHNKWTQLLLRGIASEEMGDLDDALKDFTTCQEIYDPPNGSIQERVDEVKRRIANQGSEEDPWALRKQLRGKKPEKSIAFVTAPLPEPWHPETEKEGGAGGAETCIMRLAPRFAADGWRVAVFGSPGPHRGVDEHGIEWWGSEEWLPNEQFKVTVSSRVPQVFQGEVATDHKLLWMHDVNVGPQDLSGADLVLGLTDWHTRHLEQLYGEHKYVVMPNGFETDLYADADLKRPYPPKLIYSSSPDRGLDILLGLWGLIRETWGDAELHIFYGWNIIDKIIQSGNEQGAYLFDFKNQIVGNIEYMGGEEGGIYQHGRIPQKELAEHQKNATIWAYPTNFMETFCITALETQAAGVIPATSDLAGLTETVALADLRVRGWNANSDYQTRWFRLLERLLNGDEEELYWYRHVAREHAMEYSWDNVYGKWNSLFKEIGVL